MSTPYRTVAFHTLGCKLNYSESSMLENQMKERGFISVNFKDGADFFVINSCSVTDNADKECRKIIRRAKRISPNSKIAVIGCYAQLKPEEIIGIDGVNFVLGAEEKFNLIHHFEGLENRSQRQVFQQKIEKTSQFYPSWSRGDRTRSFLKIQDGCDYNCSFCTIPMARGMSRSQSINKTLIAAHKAAESPAREIVLTGVNIGDFGKSTGESFYDLICKLDKLDGIDRFRISSIEPNLLTDDIVDFVSRSEKFMPHFHIPLQSGSDAILKNMRRRYSTEIYKSRIEKIKKKMPNCCIGVDVITGFPGESEQDFLNTCHFLEELDFTYLHVFTYSERSGTDAVKMENPVPMHIRRERSKTLHHLSDRKKTSFYIKQKNSIVNVLFESCTNGWVEGWSENYIRVKVRGDLDMINSIARVKLIQTTHGPMEGALLN